MSKAKRSAQKHPFLFYGHRPEDWAEGAQMWLIRFEVPTTSEQRVALARMVAEAAFDGSCDVEDFFFSDSEWAAVTSEDDPDTTIFDAVGKLLRAVHAVAPLAEVILATAKELGESPWDRWSRKVAPLPSAFGGVISPTGDHYSRLDAYEYGDDFNARCEATAPIPVEEDEGFAAARRERFVELLEGSREAALKQAARSSKPTLVPSLDADVPPRLEGFAWTQTAETGRVVAINDTYPHHLVILDPGVDPRELHPDFEVPSRLSLSPDGKRALLVVGRELIELNLEDGSHRVVFTHEIEMTAFSAGYCGSANRVLTCYGDHTLLLDRRAEGGSFEVKDTIDVDGVGLVVLRGKFGFLFDSRKTRLVGASEDSLADLGSVPLKLKTRVFEATVDGAPRIFARQATGLTYEVLNLDKAWDKAFPKKEKATPKTKASRGKPQNVKLKLVHASAAPDPDYEERWRGAFDWARWVGEASSGRLVLRTRKGIALVEDKKIVREVDLGGGEHFMMSSAQVHPTAERVLLVHGDESQLSWLDLDTGTLRVLIPPDEVEARFGDRLGAAMMPAEGWVVVLQEDKLSLHSETPEGLSDATASMATNHWDMEPLRGGRVCVLGGGGESQIVEVQFDDTGTPTGFRHVATLKMPGKKYKNHHASPVMELDGELFLFTNDGCFRAPAP